ncbi:hypothetical protein [Burkholderia vietnamiensis]|uniref:hypothetical protein n=1 Tax=Burkholderia vietnamiensis TaxID=60552 RepID=UPI0015916269|nr:hypothetical protein [Burkholderia vietnamiensis]
MAKNLAMLAKDVTSPVPNVDVKEIASLIEHAITVTHHAYTTFVDLLSLFESIKAHSERGSLAARLATLGQALCEDREVWFDEREAFFDSQAERFETVSSENEGGLA